MKGEKRSLKENKRKVGCIKSYDSKNEAKEHEHITYSRKYEGFERSFNSIYSH